MLTQIYETADIFRDCYCVRAFSDSQPQSSLAKAESPRLRAHPVSVEKKKAYSYPLFTFDGQVFIAPETAARLPEMDILVRPLREKKEFTLAQAAGATGIRSTRLTELVEFLAASHLLQRLESRAVCWRVDPYQDGGVSLLDIEDRFE